MARLRHRRPPGTAPIGTPAGDAQDQAGRILSGLDDLRHTPVRDVMTPRVDVVGLPIPVTASDLARAVRQSGHSTFPVYDEDLDNLVGVLYARDLFRSGWAPDRVPATSSTTANGDEGLSPLDISRRIRKPFVVPESRLVLDVLAAMRKEQRTFAVVVDEYGGVAGIATIKDLLAALVGDLRDEFDRGGEPDVIRVDRSRWLVDGGTSVDDLREQLGVPIPDGDYVTLGGFLLDVTGHIPEEGERVRRGDWEYRIVEMDRRRIAKVVLKRLVADPDASDAATVGDAG